MRNRGLARAFCAVLMTWLSGSGCSSEGGAASGCTSDSECKGGRVCVEGTCTGGAGAGGVAGGAGSDVCGLGCSVLYGTCGLCIAIDDRCILPTECPTLCRDQSAQAIAECILRTPGCDPARIEECLSPLTGAGGASTGGAGGIAGATGSGGSGAIGGVGGTATGGSGGTATGGAGGAAAGGTGGIATGGAAGAATGGMGGAPGGAGGIGGGCSGTFYLDSDRDGFGDANTAPVCDPVGNFTATTPGDCCDSDPNAFPGQSDFFLEPSLCGDYDYDCDGSETMRTTACGSVECMPGLRFWPACPPPACGLRHLTINTFGTGICLVSANSEGTQPCR